MQKIFGCFFFFLRPAFGHGHLGHPQSLLGYVDVELGFDNNPTSGDTICNLHNLATKQHASSRSDQIFKPCFFDLTLAQLNKAQTRGE